MDETTAREQAREIYDNAKTHGEIIDALVAGILAQNATPPPAQAQVVERKHEEDDWRITCAIRADKQGRSWHVGERESGSISVFYTRPEVNGHYVVYDTSESHPLPAPQQQADGLRGALSEIETQCDNGMGEWCSVIPPYLPDDMEVLYDIRENVRALLKELKGE